MFNTWVRGTQTQSNKDADRCQHPVNWTPKGGTYAHLPLMDFTGVGA